MVTTAIFGAGSMGLVHGRNASTLSDVKYICTPNPENGKELAEEVGAQLVNDPDIVINDPDVDLVVLAYPTYTRENLIERSLSAGKYIFCEKPLALTLKSAQKNSQT